MRSLAARLRERCSPMHFSLSLLVRVYDFNTGSAMRHALVWPWQGPAGRVSRACRPQSRTTVHDNTYISIGCGVWGWWRVPQNGRTRGAASRRERRAPLPTSIGEARRISRAGPWPILVAPALCSPQSAVFPLVGKLMTWDDNGVMIQFRLLSCAGGYAREARRSASLRHRRSRALYPCRGVSVCVWPIRNYTIR